MPRLNRKISKTKGLPPGTLVHVGKERSDKIKLSVIDYTEAGIEEKELKSVDECFPY